MKISCIQPLHPTQKTGALPTKQYTGFFIFYGLRFAAEIRQWASAKYNQER